MKLHDLRPADGSRTPRRRVGRGIAGGQGKTAGRGTKGQKARAGGSIQPWFEGGQTPLHRRIPKLRGFRNPFKIEYEVVNIGRIAELAQLGAFEPGDLPGGAKRAKSAPITVNQEILRAVGLVRTLDRPLKVLGHGDVDVPLFVVADAFSKSAAVKIEAAGGSVQVLEFPGRPTAAGRSRPADRTSGSGTPTESEAAAAGASTAETPAQARPPKGTSNRAKSPDADKPHARGSAAGRTQPPSKASASRAASPTDDAPVARDAEPAETEPDPAIAADITEPASATEAAADGPVAGEPTEDA